MDFLLSGFFHTYAVWSVTKYIEMTSTSGMCEHTVFLFLKGNFFELPSQTKNTPRKARQREKSGQLHGL